MLKLCFMLLVWQDTASGMLHSHSKIDKLACQAQSVEILTQSVKILDAR
jgi:hypothetical protein